MGKNKLLEQSTPSQMNSLYDSKDTNKHTVCSFQTSINVKVLQWKHENIDGICSKMLEPDTVKRVPTSNHQFKTNSTMKYTFDPSCFYFVLVIPIAIMLPSNFQCCPSIQIHLILS